MPTVLGIESTAHTFGVGIVKNGKILSNVKKVFTTEKGGMIPIEVAKHHFENKHEIYFESLDQAGIKEEDIDAIAFSQGPGLAPCLLEGMKFAEELSAKLAPKGSPLEKIPIVPVNHCVAHLEIGKLTGAKNPVLLYVSGANTQVIAYASGKYRVFGETLDVGVGNFIDTFARYSGIGFPGGPKIEELAKHGKKFIELPYSVKGMDIALSGILTNLKQKLEKIKLNLENKNLHSLNTNDLIATKSTLSDFSVEKVVNAEKNLIVSNDEIKNNLSVELINKNQQRNSCEQSERTNYTKEDLAFSMQETVFAMLVETAERALAHTGKKELLLGGGVACNLRLQEMCKIMCKERGAKFFCPEKSLLVDNAGMIAYLGEIMFKSGIKFNNLNQIDILPRQRTDDVIVKWK